MISHELITSSLDQNTLHWRLIGGMSTHNEECGQLHPPSRQCRCRNITKSASTTLKVTPVLSTLKPLFNWEYPRLTFLHCQRTRTAVVWTLGRRVGEKMRKMRSSEIGWAGHESHSGVMSFWVACIHNRKKTYHKGGEGGRGTQKASNQQQK